jgi:hypothetical protein
MARWSIIAARIVGSTQSADFPVTRTGRQPGLRGRIDAFVVKVQP